MITPPVERTKGFSLQICRYDILNKLQVYYCILDNPLQFFPRRFLAFLRFSANW